MSNNCLYFFLNVNIFGSLKERSKNECQKEKKKIEKCSFCKKVKNKTYMIALSVMLRKQMKKAYLSKAGEIWEPELTRYMLNEEASIKG